MAATTRPDSTGVIFVPWQISEEGIDIRPGDEVDLVVSAARTHRFTAINAVREVHFEVDFSEPSEAPVGGQGREFLSLHGVVDAVESVRHIRGSVLHPDPTLTAVASTLHATSDALEGAIVTLAPGATVSSLDAPWTDGVTIAPRSPRGQ